jgi:murein DD-endopeptidase MepM/ murein hydrolase activator NlpD
LKDKYKNKKIILAVGTAGFVLVVLLTVALIRMEHEEPVALIDLQSPYIGRSSNLTVSLSDQKSGLRSLWIAILQDGKETVLVDQVFPSAGMLGYGSTKSEAKRIAIEPRKAGLKDGSAMLRLVAVDYSWRKWGQGNRIYLEEEIIIDTRTPELEVLSKAHNISPGGTGLIVYKASETCPRSGVVVGEHFFPGYTGAFENEDLLIAFFALNHQQGHGTEIYLEAVDRAGNSTRSGFSHYIKKKTFKKDVIRITDGFLSRKLPEFDNDFTSSVQGSAIEKFLFVNQKLRRRSQEKIGHVTRKSDATMYWQGAFGRLPGSATRSGFGDRRTYLYKGQKIDQQVHLGIDLASSSQSPIPAANNGKIVFAERLGIYGKTIIIDHGFGLFSMYSHLSGFDKQVGQMVSKGDIIGRTGSSGLAGGDHLHFSVLVNDVFVNPLEWWDATWIIHNVTGKIKRIGGQG